MSMQPNPLERKGRDGRWVLFVLIALASAMTGAFYVLRASMLEKKAAIARRLEAEKAAAERPAGALEAVLARPHVLFLETSGDDHRRIAAAPLDDLEARVVTDVACQRFHWANGRGLALGSGVDERGARVEGVLVLDTRLQPVRTLALEGIPSRVRVSPDGALGAATVFVFGDSYAGGDFSTRTWIYDLAGDAAPFHLEDARFVDHGGAVVDAIDRNFWGVTFKSDPGDFMCTMQTGGERYLVSGSRWTSAGFVIGENVECPSISPDETRIAFKKRSQRDGRTHWTPAVFELASSTERVLEVETRSIDDQCEWLDERTILYAARDAGPPSTLRPDVWALDVAGGTAPRLFLRGAMSPCVVREPTRR